MQVLLRHGCMQPAPCSQPNLSRVAALLQALARAPSLQCSEFLTVSMQRLHAPPGARHHTCRLVASATDSDTPAAPPSKALGAERRRRIHQGKSKGSSASGSPPPRSRSRPPATPLSTPRRLTTATNKPQDDTSDDSTSTHQPHEDADSTEPAPTSHAAAAPHVSPSSHAPPVPLSPAHEAALRAAQVAGVQSASASDHEACFRATATALGLSATQVQQMTRYLDYMLETNKVMNLTAVRDPHEALTRHLVDSLVLLPVIEQHAPAPGGPGPALTVIDVGTGAGLPGMVLAAARPQWRITLLDTLRKRCDFLKRAADTAGLKNVEVVWARAEDGARQPALRDAFDVSVARAVADSRVLAELCLPYVRPGGVWVAAKGPDPEVEVSGAARAIQLLGGAPASITRVASFSSDGQRTAVVVRKTRATPQQYPRAPGTPNRSPL